MSRFHYHISRKGPELRREYRKLSAADKELILLASVCMHSDHDHLSARIHICDCSMPHQDSYMQIERYLVHMCRDRRSGAASSGTVEILNSSTRPPDACMIGIHAHGCMHASAGMHACYSARCVHAWPGPVQCLHACMLALIVYTCMVWSVPLMQVHYHDRPPLSRHHHATTAPPP